MTILAPVTKSESSTDPRDPLARLENLFDPGTTVPLHARDKSGVLAASGNIDGVRTIAYCSDATVMGGAMGVDGCKHLVKAIDTAIEEESPSWASGTPVARVWLKASKRSTPSDLSSRPWSARRVSYLKFRSCSALPPVEPRTVQPSPMS
ncbi:hypothetical protein GCM10020255_089920 [Rhodococcus baikonurensis]